MISSDYEKLFEPYARENYPLEKVMDWLKDTAKIEKDIVDQVVTETMGIISQGADFTDDCKCGCDFNKKEYPDANISHYMLSRAADIKNRIGKAKIKILQDIENTKFEARLKQQVNSDKQMYEAYHGTWSQRNLPTFRRWLRFKD